MMDLTAAQERQCEVIAAAICIRVFAHNHIQDAIQEAMLRVSREMAGFDSRKGSIEGFISGRAAGAVWDYLRDMKLISRKGNERFQFFTIKDSRKESNEQPELRVIDRLQESLDIIGNRI